jgi:uncharacterized membrane protein YphA (DoxX/SURF4 family)
MASLRPFLGRYTEQTYALMRIVVPFVYLCHGAQKLLYLATRGSGIWSLDRLRRAGGSA